MAKVMTLLEGTTGFEIYGFKLPGMNGLVKTNGLC